jgi:hypothetical protein
MPINSAIASLPALDGERGDLLAELATACSAPTRTVRGLAGDLPGGAG